ncbi:hypothetical protein H0H92_001486 [Tricholoma furcatifolium]|nr:hypothetical protein H0H92_001486 [Tricholoma furcatifolium]
MASPASPSTIMLAAIPSESLSQASWAQTAIVFDMDHTFDVARLHRLLIRRLVSTDVSAAESVAQQSLRRLQISRPSSTAELAVSLSHLPLYHANHLADEEIGMVAIDSISSHYWPDRFFVEQTRSLAAAGSSHSSPLQHVLSAIKSLSESHRPLVVMTNWGLYSINNTDSSLYKQHLQPFPIISHDAGGAQPDQVNLNPIIESIPDLTCHITLRRETSLQHPKERASPDSQQVQFSGLVQKFDSTSVKNFLLSISTENLEVVHRLID